MPLNLSTSFDAGNIRVVSQDGNRADLEIAAPEQANAHPVAGATERLRRPEAANRQDRIGQQDVALGALEDGLDAAFRRLVAAQAEAARIGRSTVRT